MRIAVVFARVIALVILVSSGAIVPPRAVSAGGVDLTGTWTCCGTGGAPAQTWLLTQTGDDLSGQARRPGGSLLGSITGTIRGADVVIYVVDISTGSAVGYSGTASGSAMSGTWSDANRGTSGTWRATTGDDPPDECPIAAKAIARASVHRRRAASPAADDCLRVVVKLTTPHQGGVSAGDRVKVVVRPTTKNTTGQVTLTVTPPDRRHARVLTSTITSGHTSSGDDLVWRFPAASLQSVSFTVVVRSDARIDDPWADTTLGVVATAVQGARSAVASKQVDLLPCGQQPPAIPASQQVAASGWTFRVGVDPRYGLAVNDLRLTGLDGARSRLVARRISVAYLQLQTSRTTLAQFETQVRLRPDGDDAFGRSRLLKLKLSGTSAGDDTSRRVRGLRHRPPGEGLRKLPPRQALL